jgi:hypothetical protein
VPHSKPNQFTSLHKRHTFYDSFKDSLMRCCCIGRMCVHQTNHLLHSSHLMTQKIKLPFTAKRKNRHNSPLISSLSPCVSFYWPTKFRYMIYRCWNLRFFFVFAREHERAAREAADEEEGTAASAKRVPRNIERELRRQKGK